MDFIEEQEQKLSILRKKWKEATYRKEKQFIERQANLIKYGIEEHKKNIKKDEELQEVARDLFTE